MIRGNQSSGAPNAWPSGVLFFFKALSAGVRNGARSVFSYVLSGVLGRAERLF